MKRSIKSLLAALVVTLSIAAPVLAGTFEDVRDAKAAFGRGDYATALPLIRFHHSSPLKPVLDTVSVIPS